MREAELYPPLKRHFEGLGYAVYAEVPAPHGGYVDLLAVGAPVVVAVELKRWFSRAAVRQAGRNRRYVWESYVAVPESARIPPRRRAALKRHGAGLLTVGDSGVCTPIEARRQAPPCTLREAFGRRLQGELASLYAAGRGGVPTRERTSAFRVLLEKTRASLQARGGIANTDQVLADTLPWNYFRSKRGGLRWILQRRFANPAADLWALKKVRKPADYAVPLESLVRSHLPDTYVCLPAPAVLPRPGDFLNLLKNGELQRRARVVSAERHSIVETRQRELRAGPAVFFRWRCPEELALPAETLVVRLAS